MLLQGLQGLGLHQPKEVVPLTEDVAKKIVTWKSQFKYVFCSNANSMLFDASDNEIYGILTLLDVFRRHPKLGLIISDASAEYSKHFAENQVTIPPNVLLVKDNHDFLNIIRLSDCMIRATSTDGDSLSVRESLEQKTNVIASDCVSRPDGCLIYQSQNIDDLENQIVEFDNPKVCAKTTDGFFEIKKLYFDLGIKPNASV